MEKNAQLLVIVSIGVKDTVTPDMVKAIFKEMKEPTIKEPGNIKYDLWQKGEQEYLIVEEWTCAEALAEHMEKPYIKDAKISQYLTAPPEVQKITKFLV